jgi:hypothetical protein
MNSTDHIENEQAALAADDKENMPPQIVTPTELPDAHLGVDLDIYLDHLEEEFGPRAESLGDDRLSKIRIDLKSINRQHITNQNAHLASQSLLEVFQNMQAWENQMRFLAQTNPLAGQEQQNHYLSSKKLFLASCHQLYPEVTVNALAIPISTEIAQIKIDLAEVEIPDIITKIQKLPDLEILATRIGVEAQSNPAQAIHDLEEINLKISQGLEPSLRQGNLSEADQKQLNICVEVLYKIQIMIDKIKTLDSSSSQESSANSLASPAENSSQPGLEAPVVSHLSSELSVSQPESQEARIRQIEERWRVLFGDDEDCDTIDKFLVSPLPFKFDYLKFDPEQSEKLDVALEQIRLSFQIESNTDLAKINEYKLRIGQTLDQIL